MAKRRKTAAKKKAAPKSNKVFILMHSICGSLSQAVNSADDYGAQTSYTTAAAALKDAGSVAEDISSDRGDGVPTMYVAEVIQVGKPTGMTWSTNVDD